ncbi:MAG: hypothetical protein JWN00_305 [Actinomycetia bacterium]|jgi:hypothetical protein|nr:hypothetical protein [Actinomycetes bacterium]
MEESVCYVPRARSQVDRVRVFAAVCVTLATAGHGAAAHAALAPWAIGVGFAWVFIVAWALTGTDGAPRLLGGLGLAVGVVGVALGVARERDRS